MSDALLTAVRACQTCADHLPHGVRPVLQWSPQARILIAGQAPGRRVHDSGVPFDDPSGDRLRDWMGVSRAVFYDPQKVAILPMGFCYPGTGSSGDLPPRRECAPQWRNRLVGALTQRRLTLVVGQYAATWHLPTNRRNLTETVRAWREFAPEFLPLPHPSPRNNIWMARNRWFEQEVLPGLRERVRRALED